MTASTSISRDAGKPPGEVGPGEQRLQAQAHGHQGGVLRLLTGAVLDDGGEHGGENDAGCDGQQQAERCEPAQQTGRPQAAEKPRAPPSEPQHPDLSRQDHTSASGRDVTQGMWVDHITYRRVGTCAGNGPETTGFFTPGSLVPVVDPFGPPRSVA